MSTLAEAAVRAEALAAAGKEQALAVLRREWEDALEDSARSQDYRVRAVAYRAVGQFRWRQKIELLGRGLDDTSPACRGSALISLELLSRDSPGPVNGARPLLHRMASGDGNAAVQRLAVLCLARTSPSRETITLLAGMAGDDRYDRELREAARKVAASLKKKADTGR